jgi:hypothetical protein
MDRESYEYLPQFSTVLVKLGAHAEKDRPPGKYKQLGRALLAGGGGIALGTASGYGLGRALEAVMRHQGRPVNQAALRWIPAVAGAGLGFAHNMWRGKEHEEFARAE